MKNEKKATPLIAALTALGLVAAGVFGISYMTGSTRSAAEIQHEKTSQNLEQMLRNVEIRKGSSRPIALSGEETPSLEEVLPALPEEYVVTGEGDVILSLWSSPEKAGKGTDSWLTDLVSQFNAEKMTTEDGSVIGITLRSISSGLANDYITSGKAVPDLYTPSSSLWSKLLEVNGVYVDEYASQLLGNCAGLFIENDTWKELEKKYGTVTLETVVQGVMDGSIAMGYTNPYTSTTGLNFLGELNSMDLDFVSFQRNIPYVATTSNQMVESARKGTFKVFVGENQQYHANPLFEENYTFLPFGTRHDNPLYGISLEPQKKEAAEIFARYITSDKAIAQAKNHFFFQDEEYQGTAPLSGAAYTIIQDNWKQEKDSGRTVVAFFIADTSGSMVGSPLQALQTSLLKTMQNINDDAHIGLISYSDAVTLEMPLTPFGLNAKAQFKGAVSSLMAGGSTSTYEAILAAIAEIQAYQQAHPELNIAPKLILLSDGEANGDYTLEDIEGIVRDSRIPIYTVGYNYHNNSLDLLASLTESASMNADEQDVVTKLRDLFRINL